MLKALQKLAVKKAIKPEVKALRKQQYAAITELKKLQEIQLKHL